MQYKGIRENFPLKNFTTYCIGGKAKFFYIANNTVELLEVLNRSKDNHVPYFLIGGGSNILISDDGFPGLVIKLGKNFNKIIINEKKKIVIVGSAVKLPRFCMYMVNRGWEGFEFMCAIPGTMGGAVRINAGTKGGEIKDNFISTKILTTNFQIKTFKKNEMGFSYRHSNLFNNGGIVLESKFVLKHQKNREDLRKKVKKILLERKNKQPKNHKNCGSVFKNPLNGKSAGWYIEQTKLKGMKVGDAQVSFEHANWIINLGNAKAQDVKRLIQHIQAKVSEKFGITLEKEVIYAPEDVL